MKSGSFHIKIPNQAPMTLQSRLQTHPLSLVHSHSHSATGFPFCFVKMRLTFWTLSYNVLICSLNFSRMTISTEWTDRQAGSQLASCSIGCLFAYLWVYYFQASFSVLVVLTNVRNQLASYMFLIASCLCGHIYFWYDFCYYILNSYRLPIGILSHHTVSLPYGKSVAEIDIDTGCARKCERIQLNRIESNRIKSRSAEIPLGRCAHYLMLHSVLSNTNRTLSPCHLFRSPLYFNLYVSHSYHDPSKNLMTHDSMILIMRHGIIKCAMNKNQRKKQKQPNLSSHAHISM